jgi:carbon monoxide dehydrogenase subunit G
MELTNEFHVPVPPSTAWSVLTDVERIAPCMPGAQLQEIEGDEYRGIVKVKVGPITAQYKGKATFVERDEDNHRAVLKAEGRDTRGQGNASATITATLVPDGEGTHVTVQTDLTVTGKVAQFGRGVMADVSAKLLGQFVECLETTVLGDPNASNGSSNPGPVAEETARQEEAQAVGVPEGSVEENAPADQMTARPVRTVDHPEPEPVNLIDTAGAPVMKRLAPILALVAVGWLLRVLIRRRRRD